MSTEQITNEAASGGSEFNNGLEPPKLADYGCLIDDYDVAAVEEKHMQAAIQYGWREF